MDKYNTLIKEMQVWELTTGVDIMGRLCMQDVTIKATFVSSHWTLDAQ